MKREFLKELGLNEDAVNQIMAENGKDIETAKGDVETVRQTIAAKTAENEGLKQQIAQRDSDIEQLKTRAGDNEKLTKDFADLQNKYAKDTAALNQKLSDQQEAFVRDKATDAFFDGVKFTSQLAKKAAIEEFKAKKFALDNGKFVGANDWLDDLRKTMPDAFVAEDKDKKNPPQFSKPLNQQKQTEANPFNFNFAKVR